MTYQAIIAEGEKELLLSIGSQQFGPPVPVVLAMIDAMSTTQQVETVAERLLEVGSWKELLALPP